MIESRFGAAWALASCLLTTVVLAQDVPLPSWVKSGEVNDDGAVVYSAADEHAPRRGTVAIGTRLPVLARVRGAGCGDFRFVRVGDDAFVCEQKLTWSKEEAKGIAQPPLPPSAAGAGAPLLPHQYAFVSSDGTGGYARPSDYQTDEFAILFGQDFGVVMAEHVVYDGIGFTRTAHNYYVMDESLRTRPVSDFAGVKISDGKLDGVSFTLREPGTNKLKAKGKGKGKPRTVSPQLTAAPKDLLPNERWVDVDTERQVLVVYEGEKPIFATLVSTGLPSPLTETPKGEFRVWAKLASADMNDTENEDAAHNYSIESVPWVVYFHESVALHAAFWHDRFGEKHSHGCVNLSPRDARTVFELLSPALPDGYYAILPTAKDPGARVIVR